MKRSVCRVGACAMVFTWAAGCATSPPSVMSAREEARYAEAIEASPASSVSMGSSVDISVGRATSPETEQTSTPAQNIASRPERTFSVSRQDYEAFFGLPPASVLSRMALDPIRDGVQLLGYRVVELYVPFEGVDLIEGDIIVSVDGRIIQTPDAYFQRWSALREASGCDVVVQRGMERFTLSWRVQP